MDHTKKPSIHTDLCDLFGRERHTPVMIICIRRLVRTTRTISGLIIRTYKESSENITLFITYDPLYAVINSVS